MQLGLIFKVESLSSVGGGGQDQKAFVEIMVKDGRKFHFTCKNYVECDDLREKIRNQCFPVQVQLDQAQLTFANQYFKAIFHSMAQDVSR